MKRVSVVGVSLLLLCAAAVAADPAPRLFLVGELASRARHAPVRAQARELEAIYNDLARVSGVDATFVYSTSADINASATEVDDRRVIVVQLGLLAALDGDRDAVAAVLGHELAHHKADHVRAGQRKKENVALLGSILGAVVGARVGRDHGELAGALGGAAVGAGTGLLVLKFNRTQELEADRMALQWMVEAGYNPQGMLRLQQRLGALDGKRRSSILRTHPTGAKRYEAAKKQIARLAPAPELLARAQAPLVDEAALAAASEAIAAAAAPASVPAVADGESVRGAALAAQDGDATVDREQARGAGVNFGKGVKVGGNVRIGGKAATRQADQGDGD